MTNEQPATPKLRWFYPTPGRLLVILLAVEGVLLLSERFQWFAFNEHKGWVVLIAVGVVGVFLLLMLLWFIVSLIFRWHFQFSIRSLLVLTVAVAIPASWLAVEMKWAREQREAVDALVKLGGRVDYDYQFDPNGSPTHAEPSGLIWLRKLLGDDFFTNVTCIFLSRTKVTDADLKHLVKFNQLKTLAFGKTALITDAGLNCIEGMNQLKILNLVGTCITDIGLEHLKDLKQLQVLDLSGTPITGMGLEHLKDLKQLHHLFLTDTKITDTALTYLKEVNQLKSLNICHTQITGSGLEHLKGLQQLQELALEDTQLTDAGLEHVERWNQLKMLWLTNTPITDVGLKHLEKLKQLRTLDLRGTKVTDTGLKHLEELKQLKNLLLGKTRVTDAGIGNLKKAIPNVEFR